MSYKNSSRNKRGFRLSTPVRLGVAAVAACFLAGPVLSNPVNPSVINGAATFNQVGNVLTVTNSNGTIINWDKFSIQVGETTHFAQTAASSTVLNRVLSDPTAIYGTLSSNGRVWLVNPAGIMVGPGGRIDTAGFVASTLNIRNEDFLAGRHLFINDGSARDVINQGEIRTPAGGSVYLIGSNVSNEGIITTPQGETILAAGATVSLIDSATPGVKVDITGAAGNATNLGTITAEAGRIGIAGVIVRNSGTLNASSVVNEGGRIFLKASQDAYVDGNGRIVTTGARGGSVEVLGNRVAVTDNAAIDASGANGGGKILVGGDYQGKNPDIQNATITYFGSNATLKADAAEVGDGGTVIVWADDTTRAYGNISARGGAVGGDGGFVETSGHRSLSITGARVDTRAPNGQTGKWLLDPTDINIVSGGYTQFLGPIFDPGGNSTISDYDINSALGQSGLIIQTASGTGGNGNITMSGASISGANSLTLAAYGGGSATGNISITGSNVNVGGGFKALAGWNGATTYYGSDVIAGKGNISLAGSKIFSSASVDLHAGYDISLGSSAGFGSGAQSSGSMFVSAGHDLTLTGGNGSITSPQGPGAVLMSSGTQDISAGNQILLQAGSADNTLYGGSMSGGGVSIWSDADQTISANIIKLYGGASGHDNGAVFHAYGSQAITITGSGGLLEVKGGGSSGTGAYNNPARIEHGQWYADNSYYGSGVQTITVNGGGSVNLQAGSGDGVLGSYSSDCWTVTGGSPACRGSSNEAAVYNGVGAQLLDFVAGGSLAITGGSAGSQNWAGIQNHFTASTQTITGNPTITVTGGSGGGSAVAYGGYTFQLSNDASINSEGAGYQTINANSITLNAGNAAYGGAGISNDAGYTNTITTVGNLSMYGGSSSAGDPFAAGVYIGNKNGGSINLNIGGDLYIRAGSGTSSPAIIGTMDGPANVYINTGGNVSINADGSYVGIGSQSPSYGASVSIDAGGNLVLADSATSGVTIGSLYDASSSTQVSLGAQKDITIGTANGYGVLIGVQNPTSGYSSSLYINAGANGYGGNLLLDSSSQINLGGMYSGIYLRAGQTTSANGNITQNVGSTISGGFVSFHADGNLTLNGDTYAGSPWTSITAVAGIDSQGRFGYGYNQSPYGGDVSIGGQLQAVGDVELMALSGGATGTRGNITQTSAGTIAGSNIAMGAWGNVDLSGTVAANSGLNVTAGIAMDCGDGCYKSSYASPQGGNVFVRSGANISAGYTVNIAANVGYGTYGNGNVTQESGSSIVGNGWSGINIAAGGSASLSGTVTASSGSLSVRAGYQSDYFGYGPSGVTPDGGNISLAGILSGEYGVSLSAETGASSGLNGDITQSAGSISTGWGRVSIIGGGNVVLNGSIDGGEGCCSTAILVKSGFSSYNYAPTSNGGNISLAGTISGYGHVDLLAETATGSGLNGNITQSAGSVTATSGNFTIAGGGNVTLNGSVSAYGGSGSVTAGRNPYSSVITPNGGNVVIGGQFVADQNVGIVANVGYGTYINGNVAQSSGSSISGYGVHIYAGGSASLGGTATATAGYGSVSVRAGYQWGYFGPGTSGVTPHGGNIALNAGSSITGTSVGLDASSGTIANENGNILQVAGGTIAIIGASYNSFVADGDLMLDGLVSLNSSGGGSLRGIAGGYYGAVPGRTLRVANVSSLNGGYIDLGSTGNVQIGSIYAPVGSVGVTAGGAISGSLVTAAAIDLYSRYGGAAGGPAISVGTSATSSLAGYVAPGATYGGISISNQGIAPSTISLTDHATYNAAVGFNTSGDLALAAGHTFYAGSGDIFIASGGSMTGVDGTHFSAGTPANMMLVAGTDMSFAGPLTSAGNVGLVAGGLMNIGQPVSGLNVVVTGATTTIDGGGAVSAASDAVVFGSVINIGSGLRVSGTNVLLRGPVDGTGILNLYGGVTATGGQLEFNLANVNGYGDSLSGYGGSLSAAGSTSNITGLISGNVALDNGAYFRAGDDVNLTFTGPDSTLSLSNGGYILADALTTINLAFPARTSGGVLINGVETTQSVAGGSGLFAVSHSNPAAAGAGLTLAYAAPPPVAPTPPPVEPAPAPAEEPLPPASEVDPCVVNPALCKPVEVTESPINQDAPPPPPETIKTDPTQPVSDLGKTAGGTENTFGGDDSSGGASSSGNGKGNGKDEKDEKDKKDKKDKKSDEAKDEKKDEKPAQKKVAQCLQ